MKAISILPLALAASAFVIPDVEMAQSLELQAQEPSHPFWDNVKNPEKIWEELEQKFNEAAGMAKNTFDDAYESAESAYDSAVDYTQEAVFAGKSWLESVEDDIDLFEEFPEIPPPHPPHDGEPNHGIPPRPGHGKPEEPPQNPDPTKPKKPHHGKPDEPHHGKPDKPHHGKPPHDGPPHDGPPHHGPPCHGKPPHDGPHHPHHPHHGKTNMTVYELIASSNYTTKLAKLINEFPDLVETLNGTKANYTVFAPTDRAFEKIPKHAPKPSKEFLKKLLTYHVSPDFYPAGRILVSRTLPSALGAEYIKDVPQRLSTQVSLRGLTVNFYARVIAIDIFGSNGVIHGIDSILIPPPKVVDIISALPGEFSTLELALVKTGLYEQYNDTSLHNGGTFFAPSNFAFRLLGPRINAFLFSKYGEKYLKALILYHSSVTATLYSDAIYKNDESEENFPHRIPKGFYHIDLETGLEEKKLSIDIARYGRLITMKINGFTRVSVTDGIAADGVLHVLSNVLIPPKTPGGPGVVTEDMSIEEFKSHLEPFVEADNEWDFEL